MKLSPRSWLLIILWVIATVIIATMINDLDNPAIILSIVSIPLFVIMLISVGIDYLKNTGK